MPPTKSAGWVGSEVVFSIASLALSQLYGSAVRHRIGLFAIVDKELEAAREPQRYATVQIDLSANPTTIRKHLNLWLDAYHPDSLSTKHRGEIAEVGQRAPSIPRGTEADVKKWNESKALPFLDILLCNKLSGENLSIPDLAAKIDPSYAFGERDSKTVAKYGSGFIDSADRLISELWMAYRNELLSKSKKKKA